MALGWRAQYSRYKEFYLNIIALYRRRADLRMFLEIILSLSTISIFLVFALRPTVLTIINLLGEIKTKEETVSALDRKISDLEKARNIYSLEQASIPIIESAVPSAASPDALVRQIEGLASKNSARVLGVSVGEVTLIGKAEDKKKTSDLKSLPSNSKEMSISISLTGNYQSLSSMIKDIENLRIPVKVDILGINASDTQEGRILVSVVSGRTPFLTNE